VLVGRLKSVIGLGYIEQQSSFVNERKNFDGILISNIEVIDEAKKKSSLIMFKVDFEKTYDLVG